MSLIWACFLVHQKRCVLQCMYMILCKRTRKNSDVEIWMYICCNLQDLVRTSPGRDHFQLHIWLSVIFIYLYPHWPLIFMLSTWVWNIPFPGSWIRHVWIEKLLIFFLLGVCLHAIFWSFSETTFRRLWLPKRGFRTESFAKIVVSWKSFLMNSGSGLDKPGHINLWFPRLLVAKVPKPGLNPLFPHCSSPGYLSQGAWALYSQTARRKVAYVTVPEPGYWDCQTQLLIAFNFFWRPHAGIIEIMAKFGEHVFLGERV